MRAMKRIVILISGRGSNMEAILRAASAENWPAQIAAVISNKAKAAGLATAIAAGIAARVVEPRRHRGLVADGRMLNIHPSLLPSFPGLDTHRRALEAGVKFHGATVHFVTPELDHGPIIEQATVPVLDTDTEDTLAARVLEQEHVIYPRAVRDFIEGRYTLAAGHIVRHSA